MRIEKTEIDGACLIHLAPIEDERGWFCREFCEEVFRENRLETKYVQVNHSHSRRKGTLRGLHYQLNPFAECKLVRCVKGKVLDVIVDVRKGSPTFLHWLGTELCDQEFKALYVPRGFAHGYQALVDDSEVIYSASSFYSSRDERRIRFDDPAVHIDWPILPPILSPKDSCTELLTAHFMGIEI